MAATEVASSQKLQIQAATKKAKPMCVSIERVSAISTSNSHNRRPPNVKSYGSGCGHSPFFILEKSQLPAVRKWWLEFAGIECWQMFKTILVTEDLKQRTDLVCNLARANHSFSKI